MGKIPQCFVLSTLGTAVFCALSAYRCLVVCKFGIYTLVAGGTGPWKLRAAHSCTVLLWDGMYFVVKKRREEFACAAECVLPFFSCWGKLWSGDLCNRNEEATVAPGKVCFFGGYGMFLVPGFQQYLP